MKKYLAILAGIFLFCSSVAVQAATYTVCSSGCDSTTIQGIFDNNDLDAGDIVEVRADTAGGSKTYTEQINPGSNDQGSSGNPIIMRPRSGDSITLNASASPVVRLDNTGYFRIENFSFTGTGIECVHAGGTGPITGVEVEDCDFSSAAVAVRFTGTTFTDCILRNLDIDGMTATGTSGSVELKATSVQTCSGNVIDNINIKNGAAYGLYISYMDLSNSTITRIHVDNCAKQGIYVTSSSTVEITDSIAENGPNDGIYCTGSSDCTYTRCISRYNGSSSGSYGDGFVGTGSSTVLTLKYCSAYDNWNPGVTLTNPTAYMYNCTFYGNALTSYKVERNANIWCNNPSANITMRNCVTAGSPAAIKLETTNTNLDLDYNCYGESDFYYNNTLYDFAGWKTQTGGDANSLNTDPKLIEPSAFNLQLRSDSPCIHNGTVVTSVHNQTAPAIDLHGQAVLVGPSRGAYQPSDFLWFDTDASNTGKNGTFEHPFTDISDYSKSQLLHGTSSYPNYVYLLGSFTSIDFSGYTGPINPVVTIKAWPQKTFSVGGNEGSYAAVTIQGTYMYLESDARSTRRVVPLF